MSRTPTRLPNVPLNPTPRDVSTAINQMIGGALTPGYSTAVAGSKAQVDYAVNDTAFPLENEAGIWSAKVRIAYGFAKTFTSTDGGAGSPCATIFAYANNNGSTGDICGIIADSVARANSTTVFGANVIARGDGHSGCKFVGMEIDVEPASGDTSIASGSAGLYINVFNKALPGPAIQTGTVGGGTFQNGILLGGMASTGTGLALQSSATADSLINTAAGTYSTAAILMGSGISRGLKWQGNGGAHYYDGTNTRIVLPTGGSVAVRNSTDTTSLVTFDSSGNIKFDGGGTAFFNIGLSSTSATAGAQTLPSNPVGFLTVSIGGTNRKIPYYA